VELQILAFHVARRRRGGPAGHGHALNGAGGLYP